MTATTPVLMIIFCFVFTPLILAEFARKQSLPTMEDFFLQSRNMPTHLVFFTVYATWMSAFAFIGATVYFYVRGPVYMTALAWDIFFGLLFMVVGRRLWHLGKKHGYLTPTDFFDDVFHCPVLNVTVTLVLAAFTVPYLQIQLSCGAYLIEAVSGGLIPWQISGLIFYLVIIIYLWAGGLRAVALADMFYGIFLFFSILGIGFYLMKQAGGIAYVFSSIEALNEAYLVLPGPRQDAGSFLWICMFLTVPIGALMGPQMWIRFFAVKENRTFDLMPLLISLTAIQCIGTLFSGSAAILLANQTTRQEMIVPALLMEYGSEVLCAVFFCGIASAALSTANAQIHAVAALYTKDIHQRYINPSASDKKLVSVGKWMVLLISAGAYLLLLRHPAMIIETGTVALGGTAQIFIPTLGALFWKQSRGRAATAGIGTGTGLLLYLVFILGLDANYSAVIALLSNGIVFVLLSFILSDRRKSQPS